MDPDAADPAIEYERIKLPSITLKVRYILQQGPAVLFVHGFPDSSKLWLPQIMCLAKAGFTVIAPDMRGYGGSDKPQEAKYYKLHLICDDLTQLLDHFAIQQACVVGHDWGAATAWRLAITQPHRLNRLIVLSVGHPGAGTAAGGTAQREKWWYFLFFQYKHAAEEALRRYHWELFREFLQPIDKVDEQDYVTALSAPGALTAALNWYRANFRPLTFAETRIQPWPRLKLPVLGIWSTGDKSLMETQMLASEQFVEAGMWQYVRLEGPGHWIPRDAPEKLNSLLLQLLTQPTAKL